MPNHVINKVAIRGDKLELSLCREQIIDAYKPKDSDTPRNFSFNTIIPMPESLRIESGSRTDCGIKYIKSGYVLTDWMKKTVKMYGRDGMTIVRRSAEIVRINDYVYLMERKGKCYIVIEVDGEYFSALKVPKDSVGSHMTLDWFISMMISFTMEGRLFDTLLLQLLRKFNTTLYSMALKSNDAYTEKMVENYLKQQ